jgi:hypothetical protein
MQALHALLEFREAALVERMVDAAVHPIAGEHEVGPRDAEHAVDAFGHVRPRKPPVGVTWLRQAGDRLARQSHVDHLGREALRLHPGGEVGHPAAVVRDAVAENDNPPGIAHRVHHRGRRCRFGGVGPGDRRAAKKADRQAAKKAGEQAGEQECGRGRGATAADWRSRGVHAVGSPVMCPNGHFAGLAPARIAKRWLLLAM